MLSSPNASSSFGQQQQQQQISDQELIDELRGYGENISPNASLTSKTRDLYIKKLNHYRARAKAESNPSKQYIKQQKQQSNNNKSTNNRSSLSVTSMSTRQHHHHQSHQQQYHNDNDNDNGDDGDDGDGDDYEQHEIHVVHDTNDEYVQVNNAHTSPMSTSFFDKTSPPATASSSQFAANYQNSGTRQRRQQQQQQQPQQFVGTQHAATSSTGNRATGVETTDLNYVSLREKFELDKTLSKYRSEINAIINRSMAGAGPAVTASSSNSVMSKYLRTTPPEPNNVDETAGARRTDNMDNDVVYAGTFRSAATNTPNARIGSTTTRTVYCPKPASSRSSIFGTFKLPSFCGGGSGSTSAQQVKTNTYGHQSSAKVGNAGAANSEPVQYLTPVPSKEESGSVLRTRIVPFVSHVGLQLSKLMPYLIIVIFTVIALQYARMKWTSVDDLYSASSSPLITQQQQQQASPSPPTPAHMFCADIKDTRCSHTKLLVRDLIDYLRAKAGQVDCLPSSSSSSSSSLIADQMSSDPLAVIKEKAVHVNALLDHASMKALSLADHREVALDSALHAFVANPQWAVRLLNASFGVIDDRSDSGACVYVVSTLSAKSWTCRARELAHFVYIRMLLIGSIAATLVLATLIYKAVQRQNVERDKAFYKLVSHVTALVEQQYEMHVQDPLNVKPYVAIAHIYDTLVDVSQRAVQKKLWAKVVKFIEDQESRIHLETQFIDGEETHVWKWVLAKPLLSASPQHQHQHQQQQQQQFNKMDGIGLANSTMIAAPPVSQFNNANNKQQQATVVDQPQQQQQQQQQQSNIYPNLALLSSPTVAAAVTTTAAAATASAANGWQGDAFNRSDKLMHSPTPCLKIRNMFDPQQLAVADLNVRVKIHNDILEKCQLSGQSPTLILHIACDRKSKEGCVYVKCASNEAAGRVYQTLNGTWYNGNLLNVKFLRSDRYVERFPDSVNFVKPLQPL